LAALPEKTGSKHGSESLQKSKRSLSLAFRNAKNQIRND
jgi:hypothetical protein